MAYPTVDAPYGLKPVNLVGGLPFAGATRQIPIGNAYGTAIYNGCLLYTSPSPRDGLLSRMPSSA